MRFLYFRTPCRPLSIRTKEKLWKFGIFQATEKKKKSKRSIILKLLPLMENSLVAQILHQSYKMPVPAPTHIASGKLVSAPLFSALANESVSKGRCIH